MNQARVARCISCGGEVSVPDSYTDGSQIGCPGCGVQLKILRGSGLRLVIADPLALQEQLRQIRVEIATTTRELQAAQASWGIGVNGFGIGVLYVVAKVALEERHLNRDLVLEAVGISVLVGVLLEVANFLFLAKRQAISRLSEQLRVAKADQKETERKLRESTRR